MAKSSGKTDCRIKKDVKVRFVRELVPFAGMKKGGIRRNGAVLAVFNS